jgi:hypothetical protein
VDWIHTDHNRDQWQALPNTITPDYTKDQGFLVHLSDQQHSKKDLTPCTWFVSYKQRFFFLRDMSAGTHMLGFSLNVPADV